MSSAGLMLLSAVRTLRSRAALREITPELLTHDNERLVFDFLNRYLEEHRSFPQAATVRRETRVALPNVNEPYSYYLTECRKRALYQAIREPYSDLTEALQSSSRIDMQAVIDAVNAMHQRSMHFMGGGTGIEQSPAVIDRLEREFEEASANHSLRGVTSGWDALDQVTFGYQPEDLIVWVGRPGRGKSWLLLKQAYSAWMASHRILYISMEMSADASMRRMVGLHSRINPNLIRRGTVSTLAQPLVRRAFQELREVNPIDMVTANFNRSVDQIDAFIARYQPDIVYLDAGYLLTPRKKRYGSSGRRETISDVVEEIKQLAANAHRPIVATVQFNRIAEQRRRGAHSARRDGDETAVFNPIAHLGLDVIGETDVISQAASHVLGIDIPPHPLNDARVFGFLKGREGEDGHWYCNYPANQSAPIDLSIIAYNDPRLVALRQSQQQPGQARRRNRVRRPTDLGFMNGENHGNGQAA